MCDSLVTVYFKFVFLRQWDGCIFHIVSCLKCMANLTLIITSWLFGHDFVRVAHAGLNYQWTLSVRPSVCLSVGPSVRLSRLPCPLCNIYSSGWILSILATNNHYHERVCRTQWPLTLTYIFKVIQPWLRKSCPLCSVYSSGWILFIFGINDHYH